MPGIDIVTKRDPRPRVVRLRKESGVLLCFDVFFSPSPFEYWKTGGYPVLSLNVSVFLISLGVSGWWEVEVLAYNWHLPSHHPHSILSSLPSPTLSPGYGIVLTCKSLTL